MNTQSPRLCPDCTPSRRDLLRTAGAALGAAAIPAIPRAASAAAKKPETLVAELYGTLTDAQKQAVCFGWDNPRRLMISNNWFIVPQKVGAFYTPEQQELIEAIFVGAHSGEEWVQKRLRQLKDDAGPSGLKDYSIAMFGKPGDGNFEWVMTGRHLTLRVDGDSEPGVAFGGPIFYGHAAQGFNEKPDHPGNVYWYQAQRANEVFQALDGSQRAKALVQGPVPAEHPRTLLARPAEQRPGLPVEALSRDQQELVEKVMEDLLAPYRKSEVNDARKYIRKNGGVKSLNLSFYPSADIGNDQVWDVWRLEGPTMVWYFRGSPHVHVWVYVSEQPLAQVYPSPQG